MDHLRGGSASQEVAGDHLGKHEGLTFLPIKF